MKIFGSKIFPFIAVSLSISLACSSCNNTSSLEISSLRRITSTLQSQLAPNYTVLVFLSPECPICQGYSTTLNNLSLKYSKSGIKFIGLVPGNEFSCDTIKYYQAFYKINFDLFIDNQKLVTNKFHALTTPHCFFVNNKMEILYEGLIDNYATDIGVKRQVVTQHYLSDAIEATLQQKEIAVKKTKPIGCFIE
jgi:thiol-disulfide isomerase/thioredoxin